jgi:PAT family beta-lactamase induction signal transducer AmpG
MSAPEKESVLQALLNRRMLICVFTGFSSGLPLYILISLLPAWLKSEGVNLKSIGLFALIQLPFTWKFLWAPLMDRFSLPWLGRRRGWMLLTQICLLLTIPGFGFFNPQQVLQGPHSPLWLYDGLSALFGNGAAIKPLLNLWEIAWLALALSFWGASQDIVLDAYRRELLPEQELGIGNSIHINAYRVAGLIPGSLSLILADHLSWQNVFLITALFMLPGMLMTVLIKEPTIAAPPPKTLQDSIVKPFVEFFSRHGAKEALLILIFMVLYKLGDSMATSLATPFYLDMGFSKTEIGLIAKNAGLWPAVFGAMLGGLWMIKLGINRALWLFGIVQITSILGFFWLAEVGHDRLLLAGVIGFEALGVGLGTAAFVSYIARTTHPAYTATQFALFTSLAALPRTFANATTGFIVDAVGWQMFFLFCYALAIPGMLLLLKVAPWSKKSDTHNA